MAKTVCLLSCYLICGEDSGTKLSVSVVSGRWMWACSTRQGSHNISSFTGRTDWLPIRLMGKMLRGQTVFSLRQILIHWQSVFLTSFVVTFLLTLEEEKNVGVLPNIEQQQDWNIKWATLLSNFGDCWLAATLCWSSQITCCPSGPCKHKTL